MTGATSGEGTVLSSEGTHRVVLVETKLLNLLKTHCATSEEWAVPHPLVAPVVLLLKSGQFHLHYQHSPFYF
jgi:hypothetical protein